MAEKRMKKKIKYRRRTSKWEINIKMMEGILDTGEKQWKKKLVKEKQMIDKYEEDGRNFSNVGKQRMKIQTNKSRSEGEQTNER